jgi:hypothetical protein
MTTLTANFDMSEAELRESNLLQMRLWRRGLVFTAIMLVALLGVDAYFFFTKCCARVNFGDKAITHIEIAAGMGVAYYLLMRFVLVPLICRKRLRQNPFFFNNLTIEVDEGGIRYRSDKTQSAWQWADLVGYRENERLLLLYPSKSFAHVLPKRVFADADVLRLKQWVESRVKRL